MKREDSLVSRRRVLRGLGTVIAVPFLESLTPGLALASGAKKVAAAAPPVRAAWIFVPNGVNLDRWVPDDSGSDFTLSPTLSPLAKVREKLLVLSGLTHDKGRANGDGAGDHARSASVFLTGAQPVKTSGAGIRSGTSVDQVAAQQIGGQTRFPSLEMSCDTGRNSGNCDSGYSCAYSNNISWASPTTPMAKEVDPRRLFDRVFESGARDELAESRARRLRRRKSILDFVLSDSKRLEGRLAANDRRKLDEYLTSVREIEKRIAKSAPLDEIAFMGEPEGLPAAPGEQLSFAEHVRLLSDMMVLAFQGDVTRISTFMFARAGSNRNYREVEVPDGHHDLSHHQGRPEKLEKIARINTFHIEQLAYLLERLESIEEGEGTLLDNCMILYGSGLSDGNRHNNENLPLVLAGRGGATIDTGRHVRYDHETPVCNLFLSMLDRLGADDVDSFGDSTGRLRGLTL